MLLSEATTVKKKHNPKMEKINKELKLRMQEVKGFIKDNKQIDKAKNSFKKVLNVLYRKKSDDINDEVISVFEVIRMAIFIGLPFCINPALGLLSYIVDKIISEKVNEKSEARMMGQVDKSIKLCEERLKQDLDPEEKKNVEKMLSDLKRKRNSLENYFMTVKEYKLKADEGSYDSDDDFDPNDGWGI